MCQCIDRANKVLRAQNVMICTSQQSLGDRAVRAIIATRAINPDGDSLPHVAVASYCPICGAKYGAEAAEPRGMVSVPI